MQRDSKSAEFFDAAARNELMIKQCEDCEEALPPEAAVCTTCGTTSLTWIAAVGTGTLVTWTVVHRAPNAGYADLVPYPVGVVELTEGPWLYARVDGELAVGRPLRVEFVHPTEAESYPMFVGATQ
jgi:uncharacterized OB-fold protein